MTEKYNVGEVEIPEFQGTHLWNRLGWAKENLEPIQTEYCVVWEDPEEPDAPAKVTHPDPNWMACARHGGILPPVESYWELKKDEESEGFKKHTRGPELLHNMKPIEAMTEEQAIEYLVMKDIPARVWDTGDERLNKPRFVICTKAQLPQERTWRNSWKISEDLNIDEETVD